MTITRHEAPSAETPSQDAEPTRRKLMFGTAVAGIGLAAGADLALAQTFDYKPTAGAAKQVPMVRVKAPVKKHDAAAGGQDGYHGVHAALAASARACVAAGDAAMKHALVLINKGDTSLVDCIKAVSAMTPICTALDRYAVLDAKYLKALARLSNVVNAECEAECRKHAEHHATCKVAADACLACIEQAGKLLGEKAGAEAQQPPSRG